MRRLTRNTGQHLFRFGQEDKAAFETLKHYLNRAKTLVFYNPGQPTRVIADASPVGLGAVLVQKQAEDRRIICYASRSLSSVERRYSQTEREALALVWACERFHPYIYGTKVELVTDHKPLQFIYGPRSKPSARVEWWVLRLQPYEYDVIHIPGTKNIADSLFRLLKPRKMTKQVREPKRMCVQSQELHQERRSCMKWRGHQPGSKNWKKCAAALELENGENAANPYMQQLAEKSVL